MTATTTQLSTTPRATWWLAELECDDCPGRLALITDVRGPAPAITRVRARATAAGWATGPTDTCPTCTQETR